MQYFLWIIRAESIVNLKKDGIISPVYRCDNFHNVTIDELVDNTVLLILRKNQSDMIFKQLYIMKCEEELDDDGQPTGFVLLHINKAKSLGYSTRYSENYILPTGTLNALTYGVHPSRIEQIEAIFSLIESHVTCRLIPPKIKQTSNYQLLDKEQSSYICACEIIAYLTNHYTLDEMWGGSTYKNPIANFACEIANELLGPHSQQVIKQIEHISELFFTFSHRFNVNDLRTDVRTTNLLSGFDCNIRPIKLSEIQMRHFSPATTKHDPISIALKTGDAEDRHQKILTEVASFLMKKGLTPLYSSSIDIALQLQTGMDIFEIKTTTPSNIVDQTAKGIFQLAYYSVELQSLNHFIHSKFLILECAKHDNLFSQLKEVAKTLGIQIVLYDLSLDEITRCETVWHAINQIA